MMKDRWEAGSVGAGKENGGRTVQAPAKPKAKPKPKPKAKPKAKPKPQSKPRQQQQGAARPPPGSEICQRCGKKAYANERITYDEMVWHKKCFKCENCNMRVSLAQVAMIEGRVFDKKCFISVFQSSGGKYETLTDDRRLTEHRQSTYSSKKAVEVQEQEDDEEQQRPMSVKDRLSVYSQAADSERRQAEYEKEHAEETQRAYEARRRETVLPEAAREAARSTLKGTLKRQTVVEQEHNLEAILEELSGDLLQLNNMAEFVKCTPEEKLAKYDQVLQAIREQGVTTFECCASGLDDAFASKFAEFLRQGEHQLKSVNIENNKLTAKGIVQIAEAMAGDSSIETLKLILNTNHTTAAVALAKLLDVKNPDRNRTLLKLTFEARMHQHRDAIEKGLRENLAIKKGWKQ